MLEGIAINNADEDDIMLRNIFSLIGDNLVSFHKGSELIKDVVNGKLTNLKELCISRDTNKSDVIVLLKSANLGELKRIHFRNHVTESINNMSNQLLMNKISKTVNYISFEFSFQYVDVFNILINALTNIHKQTLNIGETVVALDGIQKVSDWTDGVTKLLDKLHFGCSC